MGKCPECNQQNYKGAKTCAFCGEILDPEMKAKISAKQEREKRLELLLVYFALLITGIISLIFIVGLFNRYSPLGSVAKVTATAAAQETQTARGEATRVAGIYKIATAEAKSTASAIDAYCGSERVDQALKDVKNLAERWEDAVKLALSTNPIALAPQVEQLQRIRREARDVQVPACMQNGKSILVTSMDAQIEGCLAIMREEPAEVVNEYLDQAGRGIDQFVGEVERIQACIPNCK